MPEKYLNRKKSTVVWDGDVAVLGAGLEGLGAALACAESGRSVCLLDEAPTLGREVSRQWRMDIPDGRIREDLKRLCERQGVPEGELDLLICTLAFDRIVDQADVRPIVRTRPMRPVWDSEGLLKGVEIVGKSGRQLVRATRVVDATPGRGFARRATDRDMPDVRAARRRLYVCGGDQNATFPGTKIPDVTGCSVDGVDIRPAAWEGESILTVQCEWDSPVSPGRAAELSRSAAVRTVEYLRAEVEGFADAGLVDVAPEPEMDRSVDSSLPAETLREAGILVLDADGALADRLASANTAPERLAEELAPWTEDGKHRGEPLESYELEAAPEWDLAECTLPPARLHRHDPADVVVAGWGPGGSFAALAAAGEGCSVNVVDPCPVPGGIATAGRIHSYYYGKTGGRQDQIDELTTGKGERLGRVGSGFHPVARAEVVKQEMDHAGVHGFSRHLAFGVMKYENEVRGVITAAPDGYHIFPCAVAIDGTGDGDIAAAAGAECDLGREGDGFPQPYSYTPTVVNEGAVGSHNFDAGWADPTDTLDYSRAHFEGRKRLWQMGPYTEDGHYSTLASILGIRESRFARGPVTLTFQDFLDGRSYPDTVCDAVAHYDNHAQDYAEESHWARRHVLMCGQWRYVCEGEVPYRALYPKDVGGILMACRALSVDHDLHQLLRMQRDLQRIGEICGLAAAQSVSRITPVPEIDVDLLQNELGKRGIMPSEPASGFEESTVAEQLQKLGGEDTGEAIMRLSGMPADDPAWADYLADEDDPERRFCAAVAAALAGRQDDTVKTELREAVTSRATEPQWGHRTPPACVIALLALAEIEAGEVSRHVEGILAENELTPPTLLAVLRAPADAKTPDAVPALREFLRRSEENDFLFPMKASPDDVKISWKFAVVLRTVKTLQVLGCRDEDWRIEPYLDSPHLLVRRYARSLAQQQIGMGR